jgi:dTDP-4-dehydrorhamnose reductase
VKALILGGRGILGQSLCKYFESRQIPAVGLSHIELDITQSSQFEAALLKHEPTHVLNCAAMTAVDRCETEKEKAFLINATAPKQLAEICKQRQTAFIHISTDYVFDGLKKTPYTEKDPPNPISVYGASKAEGEKLVLQTNSSAAVVRVAWTFRASGGTFLCRLRELIQTQDQLEVANDRTGNCTYAPDLATALATLAEKHGKGIFHIANEGELSWYDFAIQLLATARELGLNPRCRQITPISSAHLNLPAKRPPYSVLDKSRYRELTGKHMRHWKETLADFLREKI